MSESRARVSREVWAKRVERWQDSGLSAPEFARELGINPSTLTFWKYQLKKDSKGSSPASAGRSRPGARPAAPPRSAFVEVEAQTAIDDRFELELSGGRRLRIPRSFDEAALRRVVRALEVS